MTLEFCPGCDFSLLEEDSFIFNNKNYCHRCYVEIMRLLEMKGQEWKQKQNKKD